MAPEISVVILCYKTGEAVVPFVHDVIAAVGKISNNWEIVLVGNYLPGDTADATPDVVRRLAAGDKRFKAVTLEKKGMMGWDVQTGFAVTTGDNIVLIDGDGQMPADDIVRVFQKRQEGGYDFVKTYRVKRHDGVARKVNSDVFNLVFRFLFPRFEVHDVNSKPKLFTRDFYNKLRLTANDWFLDTELMIQARRLNCKLGEIPTTFYSVEGRKSFVRPKHILEFLKNLARARVREFFV